MDRQCWVITCPNPATMSVHVSSVRFAGQRDRLVPVCDRDGSHVEGREAFEDPASVVAASSAAQATHRVCYQAEASAHQKGLETILIGRGIARRLTARL